MILFFRWMAGTKLGRWMTGTLLLIAFLLKAVLYGRKLERQKFDAQSLDALRKKNEVSNEINKMDDAGIDRELNKWMRD